MGRTILLVEDEAVIALAEQRQLESEGFRVILALSGEEAVRLARDPAVSMELVLMDIDLGEGIDGTEAARRILELRDIPLLFLSSHVEKTVVARTEEISSYGYVVKSSSYTVLDASIKMAFKLHAAQRELREREEALEAVDARFEQLALHGRSYVWEIDREGLFTYLSPSVEAVLGYRPEELVGKRRFYDLVPEELREGLRDSMLAILERGEGFTERSCPSLTKAGERIWISTSGMPARDGSGRLVGFQGTDTDVTSRRAVEEALANSEKRYRFLVERSPVGIGIYVDGNFSYVNPAGLRMAGVAGPGELLGRPVLDFVHPESRAEVADVMRRLAAGEDVPSFEARVLRADGGELPVRVAAVATSYEGRPAGFVIVRDESGQRGAREEIERRERELRVLTDCVPVRLAIVGARDLRYRFANKTFVKTHGLPRELVIGKEVREVIGEEAYAIALPAIEAVRRGDIEVHENIVRTETGEQWSEVTLVPVPDEEGRIERFVMLGVDITERRRTARILQGLLEEKNLNLREVHHRLKNNLSVVAGVLDQQAEEAGNEEAAALLRDAAARVASTGYLYDRLYRAEDVRSLKAGDFFPDLVREIIGILPETRRLELRADFDDFELPERTLSPLGLIVNELVTNSYKYAFPGRRDGTITLEGRLREGRVRLVYQDDGIGLPASLTTGEDAEGFGMRLISILVAQIGGGLSIGGGKGARFAIDFPLRP